jgi:hypothetical protein
MIIKKKSILVIILSILLISLVLIATLIGYYLYLNWKEENTKSAYLTSLYELNAKLYAKYISITSILIKIDEEEFFEGKPIIEGHIKNTSNKKIRSLKLKISLLDKDGRVLYMDLFYPLRIDSYSYLAPNDAISFKHLLKNCPKDITSYLKMKTRFAKEKKKDPINIDYKIEELTLE